MTSRRPRSSRLASLLKDRSAASAVEFAIVMPVFLIVLFGIIAYGSYLAIIHGIQQLTAEAARASIGGLSDSERLSLAQADIADNVGSYPLLTPDRMSIVSAATDPKTGTFKVTVKYYASNMFIFNMPQFVPAPNPVIVRSASIQRGGY
jgi:Flp pilus assembly protein TadG